MTRLFVERPLQAGQQLHLNGEEAHYLRNVLRCRPGDTFIAVDTTGSEFRCCISACSHDEVVATLEALPPRPVAPTLRLTLFAAILKGDRFDWLIQKCTELGVQCLAPVVSERTVVRLDHNRVQSRMARWQKIALEACRQCGRTDVPTVRPPEPFAHALARFKESSTTGLLLDEGETTRGLRALRQALTTLQPGAELAAFVGPEGGFSPAEREAGRHAGLIPVSLGPRVLRAETAAVAFCAVAMYEAESYRMPDA